MKRDAASYTACGGAEPSRPGELAFLAAALALYAALAVIKMRGYALEGRFWAEEGTVFYADFHGRSLLERLLYLLFGHLPFPTNLVLGTSPRPVYGEGVG